MLNMDSKKWSRLKIQRRSNPVPIWIKERRRCESRRRATTTGRRKPLVPDSPLLVIAL
uniref:Uncharacterized protein n=1 Tax=Populus trichocarpa TaxID=3694 RepID=A9PI65_POPTR|nr:unknown [Populus trichocarpa]